MSKAWQHEIVFVYLINKEQKNFFYEHKLLYSAL